jgi:outer membrane lipoprotein-sorting protein
MAMPAILLTGALLFQEKPDARALHERVCRTVEGLASARIESQVTHLLEEPKMEFTAAVAGMFRSGNRIRMKIVSNQAGGRREVDFISDGSKRVVVTDGTSQEPEEVRDDYLDRILKLYARCGFVAGTLLIAQSPEGRKGKNDLADVTSVCELTDLADAGEEKLGDRTARVLTCTLKVKGGGQGAIRLWIDPERSLPLKAETRLTGPIRGTITEELKFTTDATFEDQVFRLPEKKRE